MSKKAKEALNVEKLTALADKGYWNGEELRKCKEENITTIALAPKEQGEILHKSKGKELVYRNSRACKNCPQRDNCTKNKTGRRILRNENEEILNENVMRQKEKLNNYLNVINLSYVQRKTLEEHYPNNSHVLT